MGRKHCGKRRNCSLRAISPFPAVFSKDFYCDTQKPKLVWERVNPFPSHSILSMTEKKKIFGSLCEKEQMTHSQHFYSFAAQADLNRDYFLLISFLCDWLNATFNIISLISRRPVHLSMLSRIFFLPVLRTLFTSHWLLS